MRIFDACASGGDVRESETSQSETSDFIRAVSQNTEGWVTLAGCGPQESSHGYPTLQHGIFTYYLCETIRETEAGNLILPQILHVEVSEKVAKWCAEKGRFQNPTLNGHIIGKMPIAQRRQRVSPPSTPRETQTLVSSGLEERLAQARSGIPVSSQQHVELIRDYVADISKYLNSLLDALNSHGCEKKVLQPSSSTKLPSIFKKIIVDLVEAKKWRPLHKVKRIEHREVVITLVWLRA